MNNSVLILGGAGFIGSNIASIFVDRGYKVTVIDGLLPKTGGRKTNLQGILSEITFYNSTIEECKYLKECVEKNNLIVDCMAWTSHIEALIDPEYDLKLNVSSHLQLIKLLSNNKKIVFLASTGQFGGARVPKFEEDVPMIPNDIQGINKLAAESYYRVYSGLNDLNIISLRIPNCFGINQSVVNEDLGLIGNFIRDLLAGKTINVYGHKRTRNIVFVTDIAEIVYQLITNTFYGFHVLNVAGIYLTIEELVFTLHRIINNGAYTCTTMPEHTKKFDMRSVPIGDDRLREWLSEIPETNLELALSTTVKYFKQVL
jgi:UDP-glucose 4-epimerase